MTSLPRILLITDARASRRPLTDTVREALDAAPPGLVGIVLREKHLDARPLLALATALRKLCPVLFVSDRFDVAIAAGADGVCLGFTSPLPADVRSTARNLQVGYSLHGNETPPEDADFCFLSPVFETPSKPGVPAIGLENLRRGETPMFGLGGINAGNARSVLDAGAFGIALRGGVLLADDVNAAMRGLVDALT